MLRSILGTIVLLLTAGGCLIGCSGGGSDQPQTAPVSGRVSYQGKPVPDAAVTFIREGAPRYSSGRTDLNGRFQLTTFAPGDGAIVGENVITVFKLAAPSSGIDPAGGDNVALDAAFDEAAKQAPRRSVIPERYANKKTSDLKFEVLSGQNEFEIELTK